MPKALGSLFPGRREKKNRAMSGQSQQHLSPEAVASLPPPGLTGPTSLTFTPKDPLRKRRYLAYCASPSAPVRAIRPPPAIFRPLTGASAAPAQPAVLATASSGPERSLLYLDLSDLSKPISPPKPLVRSTDDQRLVQFRWTWHNDKLRVLLPSRGWVQEQDQPPQPWYDPPDVIDPQWSPDGSMIAYVAHGHLHVTAGGRASIPLTHDATPSVSYGLADFVAQEEMDRYHGFWWHPDSTGILLAQVDESQVPLVRLLHHDDHATEDHRYPFAGRTNPTVRLVFLPLDRTIIFYDDYAVALQAAKQHWNQAAVWYDPPREAHEYLARVHWAPDGSAIAQWQNRAQTVSVWSRMFQGKARTLWIERSDVWINLHHLFQILPQAVGTDEPGAFSFLLASERTGFLHLYLYTYVPGINGEQALQVRAVSAGDWMVESIVGVDMERDVVYVTGTYDSALERHLYALPLVNEAADGDTAMEDVVSTSPNNGVRRGLSKVMNALSGKRSKHEEAPCPRPVRLTLEPGMHSIVMDEDCRIFVDTSSDLDRPTSVRIFGLPNQIWNGQAPTLRHIYTLYDAMQHDRALLDILKVSNGTTDPIQILYQKLPTPELVSFPTSDGSETLHAALFRPDPQVYGPGPYPLVCAVYGGPHVQRVNRSWAQSADMRAQRLRSLGFCVVKCDNRGSSRRGLAFESVISRRLGRMEVLDQVAAVRQLTTRGIADPTRVGVYGWSYGGYLAAMCLCRAPDVFSVAVAGAPVTSWDGYDTHYTERYMGLPSENPTGYRESAVLDHVPNMNGHLMIVHGLIDENVHFRHTSRLINKLIAAGKDYELLVFPDERHSPRRLRDRIYMEQRISDYFVRWLTPGNKAVVRNLAGHL